MAETISRRRSLGLGETERDSREMPGASQPTTEEAGEQDIQNEREVKEKPEANVDY